METQTDNTPLPLVLRFGFDRQQPAVRSFKEWETAKERPGFPQHFPKSLHYHFGAGVLSRLRE